MMGLTEFSEFISIVNQLTACLLNTIIQERNSQGFYYSCLEHMLNLKEFIKDLVQSLKTDNQVILDIPPDFNSLSVRSQILNT